MSIGEGRVGASHTITINAAISLHLSRKSGEDSVEAIIDQATQIIFTMSTSERRRTSGTMAAKLANRPAGWRPVVAVLGFPSLMALL
jgi:acid phosphatase family membrane protein YuiD